MRDLRLYGKEFKKKIGKQDKKDYIRNILITWPEDIINH